MKFLIIFIIMTSLQAQTALDKSLDTINKTLEGPAANCQECDKEKAEDFLSDEELGEQCALDLCGSPKDTPSALLVESTFDQYTQEGALDQFSNVEPKIREMLEKTIDHTSELIAALKERAKNVELKFNFDNWSGYDYDNYAEEFFSNYYSCQIDHDKPLDQRMDCQITLPENSGQILKSGIEQYISKKIDLTQNDFVTGLYSEFYSDQEALEIFTNRWNQFYQKYLEQLATNPDFLKDKRDQIKEFQSFIENADQPDVFSIAYYANTLNSLENYYEFSVTGTWPPYVSSAICITEDCHQALRAEMSSINFHQMLSELEQKNSNKEELIDERLIYCKSQMAADFLVKYQTDELKKMIPTIKSDFFKNVLGSYSDQSKKGVQSYIDKQLILSFTPSFNYFGGSFIDMVNSEYESFSIDQTTYNEASTNDLLEDLMKYKNYVNQIDPLNDIYFCSDSYSPIAWDGFSPAWMMNESESSKDIIEVSMFSCLYPEHGRAILTHEAGHALSDLFRLKKLSESSYREYMKIRQCASALYKKAPTTPLIEEFGSLPGDHYRTEEDTADIISYQASPDPSFLLACSMFTPSYDGSTYTDTTIDNPFDTDTHSSSLVRLINEATHKKVTLPSSCQQLVDRNGDSYRFKSCF